MSFLALIFGEFVYKLNSCIIVWILRIRGLRIGRGFYIQGIPRLKIKGNAADIIIGNNVKIMGDIDLRNREKGKIVVEDGVVIDDGCRLVAANNAELLIGKNSRIGLFTVFNCGEDITVGEQVLISGFCYIQSSNHGIRKGTPIQSQPHTYGKIIIGSGAWLGSHVTVLPGVNVEEGAVIGAKSVITKSVRKDGIYVGIPAKEIGQRL
jgi:acetyltransferase-like isoleucine patch superfamily enzyme